MMNFAAKPGTAQLQPYQFLQTSWQMVRCINLRVGQPYLKPHWVPLMGLPATETCQSSSDRQTPGICINLGARYMHHCG